LGPPRVAQIPSVANSRHGCDFLSVTSARSDRYCTGPYVRISPIERLPWRSATSEPRCQLHLVAPTRKCRRGAHILHASWFVRTRQEESARTRCGTGSPYPTRPVWALIGPKVPTQLAPKQDSGDNKLASAPLTLELLTNFPKIKKISWKTNFLALSCRSCGPALWGIDARLTSEPGASGNGKKWPPFHFRCRKEGSPERASSGP
jgi:hypothetical protein